MTGHSLFRHDGVLRFAARMRGRPSAVSLWLAGALAASLSLPGGSIYTTLGTATVLYGPSSTQVSGVGSKRHFALIRRLAAAKMSRAVLLISVCTIFLDVLHAAQVRSPCIM